MADYWVITSAKFQTHPTLESADRERARLAALHPEKAYRVIRCKTITYPGNTAHQMKLFSEAVKACLALDTLPDDVRAKAKRALDEFQTDWAQRYRERNPSLKIGEFVADARRVAA